MLDDYPELHCGTAMHRVRRLLTLRLEMVDGGAERTASGLFLSQLAALSAQSHGKADGGITMLKFRILTLSALLLALCSTGCSTRQVAAGAAVGGAAYEYSNKRSMDTLKNDYESGRINKDEYERRKKDIEGRSLIY